MEMKLSFMKIISNKYVKHLLLISLVFILVVAGVLMWLNVYTKHSQSVTVPPLKGLQIDEAAAILQSAGLSYEVVDSIFERRSIPGAVLEQVPKENSKVKEGRLIYLIVQAKTEQLVALPDLTDYSQRQAEALLNALGFTNIWIEEVPSEYRGLVQSVEYKGVHVYAGRKVPKGSLLRIKVGDGSLGYSDYASEGGDESESENAAPEYGIDE
jgi:beta-lactam-binding protein with PASTA domain